MTRDDGMGIVYLVAAGAGIWVAWSVISGVRKAGAIAGGAAQAVVTQVGGALQSINPTNPDNVIAAGVNKALQTVTGDNSASLGSWIYDKINPESPFKAPIVPTPNALVRSFGGDALTREDVAWMDNYLAGIVHTADQEDIDSGYWKRLSNPISTADRLGAAAQSYGSDFNMTKL